MRKRHVHTMMPSFRPDEFYCNSCAFRCHANALATVEASKSVHRIARAKSPLWSGFTPK